MFLTFNVQCFLINYAVLGLSQRKLFCGVDLKSYLCKTVEDCRDSFAPYRHSPDVLFIRCY